MKVSVSQQQLAQGLGIVSRAVSPRSTLPVLANVLLATDEGRLRLSATNLELGISCWIGAQIQEEGSITVPARLLADLVGMLPNDTVQLSVNMSTCTLAVHCASSDSEIKGIDAQEFPPMPATDISEGVQIKSVGLEGDDPTSYICCVIRRGPACAARRADYIYRARNFHGCHGRLPHFCPKSSPGGTHAETDGFDHPGPCAQ